MKPMKYRTPTYCGLDLPDQTYLEQSRQSGTQMDFLKQWMNGRHFHERLDYIRHLFVNEVPLYMVSIERSIHFPFETFEESLNTIAYHHEEYGVSLFEVFDVNLLNELHVSYDEDEDGAIQRKVHDFTGWSAKFFDLYPAQMVFSGLTKEHQEQFLPEETGHLLVREKYKQIA